MLKRIVVQVSQAAKASGKLALRTVGLVRHLLPTVKVEAEVKVVTVKVTLDWKKPD